MRHGVLNVVRSICNDTLTSHNNLDFRFSITFHQLFYVYAVAWTCAQRVRNLRYWICDFESGPNFVLVARSVQVRRVLLYAGLSTRPSRPIEPPSDLDICAHRYSFSLAQYQFN